MRKTEIRLTQGPTLALEEARQPNYPKKPSNLGLFRGPNPESHFEIFQILQEHQTPQRLSQLEKGSPFKSGSKSGGKKKGKGTNNSAGKEKLLVN